jgi:tRNA A37 methylthiotransferase MiaB
MQTEMAAAINTELSGRTMEVLVEGKEKDNWYGRTRPTSWYSPRVRQTAGRSVDVLVDRASPWSPKYNQQQELP